MLLNSFVPWLIGLIAFFARVIPGPRTIDDAYITFRYAQNLLAGNGIVYNPGEAVLGTTTPLYMLVMAGLGLFTGGSQAPFPTLSLLVNAIADAITCWLLFKLAEALGYRRAGIAAAIVWAVAPWSVTFAIGGMETSLLILFGTATFYLYSIDKPVAAGLCGSLSLLTRPDALLFLLPLGIERLRRGFGSKKINPDPLPITMKELLAFALPTLTWMIYSTAIYGNPIPHSILAKVAAYRLPEEAALVRLLQHFATPFLGHLTFGTWWIVFGLMLFPVLYGLGVLKILREKFNAWPTIIYPWFYFMVYAIANPLIFRWYLTPPLPLYFMGIFLGVERLASDLKSNLPAIFMAACALVLTLNGWTFHPDHGPDRPAPDMAYIKLELLYEQATKDLREQIEPGQILAAGDIGALGYFTGAPILDTLGLISPQVDKYYPLPDNAYVGNYAIPSNLINDLQPDFLVILEVYGRKTLLEDPIFSEGYDQIMKIPTDMYGSDGMLIFRRR
jgi:arabinofuranosyltransferase